jgi:hypothetical protein
MAGRLEEVALGVPLDRWRVARRGGELPAAGAHAVEARRGGISRQRPVGSQAARALLVARSATQGGQSEQGGSDPP